MGVCWYSNIMGTNTYGTKLYLSFWERLDRLLPNENVSYLQMRTNNYI